MSNYTFPKNHLPIRFCTLFFWQCIFFLWHSQLKTLYIFFFSAKIGGKMFFYIFAILIFHLDSVSFAISHSQYFFHYLFLVTCTQLWAAPLISWLVHQSVGWLLIAQSTRLMAIGLVHYLISSYSFFYNLPFTIFPFSLSNSALRQTHCCSFVGLFVFVSNLLLTSI